MKKIIAIIILSFICINGVKAIEADFEGDNTLACGYNSIINGNRYVKEKNGECPLLLYKNGDTYEEIDLASTVIEKSDDYYLLEDYEILFGAEANDYDGTLKAGVAYYTYVNPYDNSLPIVISNIDGVFSSKLIANGTNFNSEYVANNFLDENNKFVALPKIMHKWEIDMYQTITVTIGENENREIPLDNNFVIYSANSQGNSSVSPNIIETRTFCGPNNRKYSAVLYDNNTVQVSGYGYSEQFTNQNSLPSKICHFSVSAGGVTSQRLYLSDCNSLNTSYSPYSYTDYEVCTASSANQIVQQYQILDGTKFKNLICQVKWAALGVTSNVPTPTSSNIDFTCSTLNGQCTSDCEYQLEQNIGDVFSYCTNDIYTNYLKFNKIDSTNATARMNECIAFNNYYNQLINAGIINDFTEKCGILSDEMEEKLGWILDIIKIAGPILALGLGTLDFVKVIVNGDADKEMKTAFKNFYTRLIAAALLFLIPFILAFLMDVFLTGKDGYDSDNPYCNIVDWGNNQ